MGYPSMRGPRNLDPTEEADLRRRTKLLLIGIIVPAVLMLCLPAFVQAAEHTPLKAMNGKRIGVQTGSTFDAIVQKSLPNAQIEYYNSYADMVEALTSHKIDGFPGDEPVIQMIAAENPRLHILEDRLESFEFGIVLPKTEKGEALKRELDDWISKQNSSGELQKMKDKWTTGPDNQKTIPNYSSLPAPKGTLTLATEGAYPPMNYYRDNEVVGLEIDLAARFCESAGYGLEITPMNFDGILPAVQSDKADFALAGITITDERKESVLFSDPYYVGGTVMAVLAAPQAGAGAEGAASSFVGGIVESFQKTFLRESRWQMFLDGVGTTLVITLLSIVLGTILGFVVFLLCRNGGHITNSIRGLFMWLVQGMPGVVLLMILYYIVFGSFSIGGVAVSVVAFTLTFGTTVFGLIKMGVGAVDVGQREAAYALGYSERKTFFKIILPQALPHAAEPFKGEVVNLIKATSIVGYIAVQDLTKMGDIVRSRTYEAFFPLIAITIIYFALEGLLGLLVSRIEFSFDPKRRTKDDILKGVKTDD